MFIKYKTITFLYYIYNYCLRFSFADADNMIPLFVVSSPSSIFIKILSATGLIITFPPSKLEEFCTIHSSLLIIN